MRVHRRFFTATGRGLNILRRFALHQRTMRFDRTLSISNLGATPMAKQTISQSFSLASERYSKLGVNVEPALRTLATISVSLHCWQDRRDGQSSRTCAHA